MIRQHRHKPLKKKKSHCAAHCQGRYADHHVFQKEKLQNISSAHPQRQVHAELLLAQPQHEGAGIAEHEGNHYGDQYCS